MKIALIGGFGFHNFGNDTSMEAMLAFLRRAYPQAEIVCICANPKNVERDYAISVLPLRLPGPATIWFRILDLLFLRLPRMLDLCTRTVGALRDFDALIVPGTGILEERSARAGGTTFSLFIWCLAARITGTRVALVSVGAGPIRHPINRWLLAFCARTARYRSYRDEISRNFMQGIGIESGTDPVFPDLVFKLPIPDNQLADRNPRPLTVGLGVMAFSMWYDYDVYEAYINKIVAFIGWLAKRGYRIRLLTSDAGDRNAVDDVLSSCAAQNVVPQGFIIAEQASSANDLMRQIDDTDVVVATRYHNIVYALKLGKPTISLGYSKKNDVLLAEMGLGDCCQDVDRVNLELLIEQFEKLSADLRTRQDLIQRKCVDLRDRLTNQETLLMRDFFKALPCHAAQQGQ